MVTYHLVLRGELTKTLSTGTQREHTYHKYVVLRNALGTSIKKHTMNKSLGFPDIEICTDTSTGMSNFKIEAQKPRYNSHEPAIAIIASTEWGF